MTEYVLGLDIGATKSHLAVFDTKGRFIDFKTWGPLNHEVLPGSFDQLEKELRQFVGGALDTNDITEANVAHAVLGVAGADTIKQHEIISGIIARTGLDRFTLCNDAFLGIPAGNPAGVGICAINGTGCTLAGVDPQGNRLQIGGMGELTADKGGGGYYGRRAVAAVYSELFLRGAPTLMTPMLFERLGIADKADFLERLCEMMGDGKFNIRKGSLLVFEAVNRGDETAAHILRESALSYAKGIAGMIDQLSFPKEEELAVMLAGSVFTKGNNPLLNDTLKALVRSDHPDRSIVFRTVEVPNVAGAVVWALNTVAAPGAYYDAVRAQLREALERSEQTERATLRTVKRTMIVCHG